MQFSTTRCAAPIAQQLRLSCRQTRVSKTMQFSTSPSAPIAQQQLRLSCRQTRPAAPPCHRVDVDVPVGLRAESLPKHVAFLIDGHSRWAHARGLPTEAGHDALRQPLQAMVRLSRDWGIRVLTVFLFSTGNWNRTKAEIDFFMEVCEQFIHDNVAEFVRDGIRLRVIGDYSRLPVSLQNTIREAEEATCNNSQFDLMLGISYSGRWDIVQACTNLARKVHDGLLSPDDINQSMFASELHTSCGNDFPNPDLLIRVSGELRLSDFLLWQLAYTELFFTKTLWPDFGEADYIEALISFQGRNRRFGGRKTLD